MWSDSLNVVRWHLSGKIVCFINLGAYKIAVFVVDSTTVRQHPNGLLVTSYSARKRLNLRRIKLELPAVFDKWALQNWILAYSELQKGIKKSYVLALFSVNNHVFKRL